MDDIEQRLQYIWKNLLHCQHVGVDDDFFELGGHSILCFELLQRIEAEFGARLQVATIFLAPTIAELADHLRQPSSQVDANVLVTIRDGGGARPLYCVPAAATTKFSLNSIATVFEGSQSFIGIEHYGFVPGTEPQNSIEDMARTYVDAIRGYQPTGPYFLAGRCFGGIVAFEMARQLIQRGDEVGLLVLLETLVPVFDMNTISRSLRPVDRRRLPGLYPDYRLFAQRTGRAIADEFAERLAKVPKEIKQLLLKIVISQ